MDKTNYSVLSIVAIVAITAIVAMFIHERAPNALLSNAVDAATPTARVIDIPLTGHVVAEAPRETKAPLRIDLNNDGSLTVADAALLSSVIDRAQFCPRNKQCDLTADGIVDTADLGELNAHILKAQAAVPGAQPIYVATDDTFAIGTTGAAQ